MSEEVRLLLAKADGQGGFFNPTGSMGQHCGWKGDPKGGWAWEVPRSPNGHKADPELALEAGEGEHMVPHSTS